MFTKALVLSPALLLGFLLTVCGHALAEGNSGVKALARIVEQSERLTYQASGVYIRPSGMLAFDLEHDGLSERIIEKGVVIKHIVTTPQLKAIVFPTLNKRILEEGRLNYRPLHHLNQHLERGLESYQLLLSEEPSQLAGKAVQRLSVIAKTPDKYSYVYWVDLQTGLILRTDTVNEQGALIERKVFTSFTLNETGSLPLITSQPFTDEWQRLQFTKKLVSQFKLGWLPPGFELFLIESIEGLAAENCERLVLSDGFALIEIYSCKNEQSATLRVGRSLDALHIVKRKIAGQVLSVAARLPYEVINKVIENIKVKAYD